MVALAVVGMRVQGPLRKLGVSAAVLEEGPGLGRQVE